MGYRIEYGKKENNYLKSKNSPRKAILTASFFILFSILVNIYWIEGVSVIKHVTNRLLVGSEHEAVETFLLNVREGETVIKSICSFFRVILHDAG